MKLLLTSIFAAVVAAPLAAAPVTYNFSLTGFVDGGTLTGSLTGEDNQGNGNIVVQQGEASAFQAMFTGSSTLPDFDFAIGDVGNVTLDLNSLNFTSFSVQYALNPPDFSPRAVVGGGGSFFSIGIFDLSAPVVRDYRNTTQSFTVIAVEPPVDGVIPVPASIWFLGAALAGLSALGRRRGI